MMNRILREWERLWAGDHAAAPNSTDPELLRVFSTADLVAGTAFLAIGLALAVFTLRRRMLRYRPVFGLFALTMLAAGGAHLLTVLPVAQQLPATVTLMKASTALLAAVTAVALWPIIPRALAMPTPADLAYANDRLEREAASHVATLRELKESRSQLERRVAQRTRELTEANHRFEVALRSSNITVFTQDVERRYTWIHNPPGGRAVQDFIGRHDSEMLPEATLAVVGPAKQRVIDTGEAETVEAPFPNSDEERWFSLRIEPLIQDDELIGITCVALDMTERKEEEDFRTLVLREMGHRSKNMIAVIQAMARQTASNAAGLDDFLTGFSARLHSLASSQDLLVASRWQGASVGEIVRRQIGHLATVADSKASQVTIEGPDLSVNAEAAQSLGMAIHELATNAAKYGALSTSAGKVSVTWQVHEEGGGERTFELNWVESGGPLVMEPAHTGFGRTVLEKTVAHTLEGEVDLDFRHEGVRCRITIAGRNLA